MAIVQSDIVVLADGAIYQVESGETVNNATVNSGGTMYVSSGGTATNTMVNSGGWVYVSSGGTAHEITENGGYVYVEDGADITFVSNIINKISLENTSATVHSGTTVISAIVNGGGTLDVYSGGTVTQIVENGGYVVVSNGAYTTIPNVFSGLVLSRRAATVHSGTTAVNTTLSSNSRLFVYSGGTASNTTVDKSGYLYIYNGATANDTTVNSLGNLWVHSGGTVNNTTVYFRGNLWVHSGGTVNNTTINSGGQILISSGGTANNTTINSHVSMYVSRDTTANNTTVNSGGTMYVTSGGTASNITVNSGGRLYVTRGMLTGQMTFEAGASVYVQDDWSVNFDLTQTAPNTATLVNDLSIIRRQEYNTYLLTVDSNLTNGTYNLAGGTSQFKASLLVMNSSGISLGFLSVYEQLKVDDVEYTLNLTDDILSVTVGRITPPEPAPPENLVGTTDQVVWEETEAEAYVVEYSTDNFEHVIRVVTAGNAVDTPDLPAGTYHWRVKADTNSEWAVGEAIVSEPEADAAPKVVQSNEDGNDDLFFANPNGTWSSLYYAQHVGSLNDWTGTNEIVSASGKGRIQNLFFGSADPNVLCLTDGENGDAIFVDDVYTDLPESVAEHTARLYRIKEIRAGAGNDIVDMTSQQFEYIGDGLTIRGGAGNDTIWANKGDNRLFGDDGNDRIVGASGNDVIAGGIGNDRMHGGGGSDVFTFCENWGADNVEQLETGTVTLWFVEGSIDNWDEATLTYTDGENSVKVSGVTAEKITLKFGENSPEDAARFASLTGAGAFADFTSQRIFEEPGVGILAGS